jgi:hypothetical protein
VRLCTPAQSFLVLLALKPPSLSFFQDSFGVGLLRREIHIGLGRQKGFQSVQTRLSLLHETCGAVGARRTGKGSIAWINGQEVARFNMPVGDVAYNGTSGPALAEPIPWSGQRLERVRRRELDLQPESDRADTGRDHIRVHGGQRGQANQLQPEHQWTRDRVRPASARRLLLPA